MEFIPNPIQLSREFTTTQEFNKWLNLLDIDELKECLKDFEENELTQFCNLIRLQIKKTNININRNYY